MSVDVVPGEPGPRPASGEQATAGPRLALLAAVGEVADGTGLLGETVQRLLAVLVPAFADVATLDAVGATGEMRRLGARAFGPNREQVEQALLSRHQTGDPVGVLRALGTGEAELIAPVTTEFVRSLSGSYDDHSLLSSLELGSTIYAPLRARGRVLGVLACSTRGERAHFTEEDLSLAEALASRIGLALDNAGLSATVSGLERRLEAALANLTAGVIVRGAAGEMIFANPRVAELLGMDSVEALYAATSEQMMELFEAYDETGAPLSLADLPSTRAMRGERPEPLVARSVRRSTGVVRWLLHTATPVHEPDGRLSIVVNVFEDITRAKRSELSQRLLSTAGRELNSSLDYEGMLQRVARMAVPDLADWCGVSLVGSGPFLEQVAVAHVDPDKVALAREWGQQNPTRLDRPAGAAEVIRSGRSQLIPEVTEAMLAASTVNERQATLVRQLDMRSVIIVPLALPGSEPFGTLSLVMAESGRRFDTEDLAVAEELGRRGALAVQNARLYTERSRVAAALEQSLRQPTLPEIPGFAVASLYQPTGGVTEVGGDFYDALQTDQGWLVMIGDVMGHGAEAAALASLSRHTLRTAARLLPDLVEVVKQLDIALRDASDTALVTVCLVLLHTDGEQASAEVLLAGHPQPYHLRGGEVTPVGQPAKILGLGLDGSWQPETVALRPGDQLVLFTDGVVETVGRHERFGYERLIATLRSAADAEASINGLARALEDFALGEPRDDVAILAVQRR